MSVCSFFSSFYWTPATMGEDDKCALDDPMGETLATNRRRGDGEKRLVPLLSTLLVRARLRRLLPADPADEMEPPHVMMELASLPTSCRRWKASRAAPSRCEVLQLLVVAVDDDDVVVVVLEENMVRRRSRAAMTLLEKCVKPTLCCKVSKNFSRRPAERRE